MTQRGGRWDGVKVCGRLGMPDQEESDIEVDPVEKVESRNRESVTITQCAWRILVEPCSLSWRVDVLKCSKRNVSGARTREFAVCSE